MIENFSQNLTSQHEAENTQENSPGRNWANLTSTDLIELLGKLGPFVNENGALIQMPELMVNGKLDKDMFAGLMTYHTPSFETANTETANEVINFLEKVNSKLNNEKLTESIEQLKNDSENIVSEHDGEKFMEKTFGVYNEIWNEYLDTKEYKPKN